MTRRHVLRKGWIGKARGKFSGKTKQTYPAAEKSVEVRKKQTSGAWEFDLESSLMLALAPLGQLISIVDETDSLTHFPDALQCLYEVARKRIIDISEAVHQHIGIVEIEYERFSYGTGGEIMNITTKNASQKAGEITDTTWPISPDRLADFIESYQEQPEIWNKIVEIYIHGGEPKERLRKVVEETAAKLQPVN